MPCLNFARAILTLHSYVFRDGQAIPDSELEQVNRAADTSTNSEPISQTNTHQSETTLQKITSWASSAVSTESSSINTPTSSNSTLNASTDSHALAEADHEEKGAAQEDHGEVEVKDLGWNELPKDVPFPLVGGLPNEELWLLVRRFNMVGFPHEERGVRESQVLQGLTMMSSKCTM